MASSSGTKLWYLVCYALAGIWTFVNAQSIISYDGSAQAKALLSAYTVLGAVAIVVIGLLLHHLAVFIRERLSAKSEE